jgi:hypothetical protein
MLRHAARRFRAFVGRSMTALEEFGVTSQIFP